MDFARPLRNTTVWSRRSSTSSIVRSRTSSRAVVSGRIPRRLSLLRSCFSSFVLCSVGMPSSERAISLNLESAVLCRQSSLLFLSPYCPIRFSSACRVSVRQGNLGVSCFFLCFFGSPILLFSLNQFAFDFFLFDAYGFAYSS